MKFANLVWRNLWRNKRRTLLTVFSVAVSIFIISLLLTVLTALNAVTETDQTELRLITRHKISLTNWLPLAYWEKIRQIPHVTEVSVSNWFGGVYIDEANFIAQFAVDPPTFAKIYPELRMVEGSWDAWKAERTAVLVHADLAKKFGWKIGGKVPITGTIYPVNLDLTVRGIFEGSDPAVYFHWQYLDELFGRRGVVGVYYVQVNQAANRGSVTAAIDRMFENSDAETKTETEKEFQAGFVSMMGNVTALVRNVSIPIAFAILMVVANTMSMSVRERTTEVAVMKALGFGSNRMLGLLLAEAGALSLVGGLVGALGFWGLSWWIFDVKDFTIPGVWMKLVAEPQTVIAGIAGALAIGLLSGLLPAWGAARLPVVDGLRRL